MRDFTLEKYKELLAVLLAEGYETMTYADYLTLEEKAGRVVVLRHDVDKRPERSVRMAEAEAEMGVRATYYFRCVACSYNEEMMKRIEMLGHEVGYHYEDMAIEKGDVERARRHFEKELERMRGVVKIRSVCMHGSPLSKYDNREMWGNEEVLKGLYARWSIVGEPYLDTDWERMEYLTDTGRCWDGDRYSRRDKVEKSKKDGRTPHSTDDLKEWLGKRGSNTHVMLTTHPQRWSDDVAAWVKELVMQNIKNVVKRGLK